MISIIVPVYNVETYLPRCVNSVLTQNYNDFELLLINDGSTDSSENVCRKFQQLDERVKLITQKNGGVSSARNTGIESSVGEYILFLDADDFLEQNALSTLLNKIGDNDLCVFGYNMISEKDTKLKSRAIETQSISKFADSFELFITLKRNLLINPPFNKLFRRELIVETFDTRFKMGEDLLFCLKYMERCNSVKILNDSFYNYVYRKDAATKTFQSNRVQNEISLFNYEKEFVEGYFRSYNIFSVADYYLESIRLCYIAIHGSSLKKEQILDVFRNWNTSLLNTNLLSFDNSNKLTFLNFEINKQYSYTLKQYGILRKVAKKILRCFMAW